MSNSSSILAYSLTTLVGLGGALQGAEEDTAALTRRIERLEKQNAALKASYVQARSDADKAAAQLVDIRSRLEALGGAALGNSEERLIQAMADIEAFNDRVQRLEQASVKLSGAILAYMKQKSHIRRCERQDGCGEFSAPAGIRSGIQATARARWRGNPGGSQGAQH